MGYKIISLFSGCGGLDLGFSQAGFDICWANEFNEKVYKTHIHNFPNTVMDRRDINKISSQEIIDRYKDITGLEEVDGIIGGPPCQAWSVAGSHKGMDDKRGKVFLEFVRVIKDIKPKFFVAENVEGILRKNNKVALENIITKLKDAGFTVKYKLLTASDYGIAQDRKRVFFIGIRNDLTEPVNLHPHPLPFDEVCDLKKCIQDLPDSIGTTKNRVSDFSQEHLISGYSPQYMSRNRVRGWDEFSFTIPASGRHIPIHPSAPKMKKVDVDEFHFISGDENMYRRLSVRECARIQSFPDSFKLIYENICEGYHMIGNAVPPKLAYHVSLSIKKWLCDLI